MKASNRLLSQATFTHESPKVYIIEGRTGEYDCQTWAFNSTVYASKNQADKICAELNTALESLNLHDTSVVIRELGNVSDMKRLDKAFRCDYNGASYEVIEYDFE